LLRRVGDARLRRMTRRFHAFVGLALAAMVLACAAPSAAQGPEQEPPLGAEPLQPIEPPRDIPKAQHGDPTKNLDRLFAALKASPNAESAKFIEGNIWAAWAASGGDTASLLMIRARTAAEGKDLDLAIKLLTAVIDIKPDFIEAWNRRATIYFLKRDYTSAMADLQAVLQREPRHFAAWAGLGMILHETGDDRHALQAFWRAVELHPHMDRIPDLVKRLTESVEGRDI
jgi:tetratricopeptide (TPR) repeat protein